jgi:hypothetical protein
MSATIDPHAATRRKAIALLQDAINNRRQTPVRDALALLVAEEKAPPAPPPSSTTEGSCTPLAGVRFILLEHADGPGIARRISSMLRS